MESHRGGIGGVLLGSAIACVIAAVQVATAKGSSWTNSAVVGLLAGGLFCLVAALWALRVWESIIVVLRPRWKWVGAAIVTPAVAVLVTVLVTCSLRNDPPDHAIARVPTICTIRGIPDSGYLDATLTGMTKSVFAVAVWIVDDRHWYFKRVRQEGASWSAPPDPTYLWEVGRPGDPPLTTFIFAMLTRSKGANHRLPGEGDGRRTIPDGFRIVGEQVALTKQELLAGGFHRRC